MPRSTRNGKRIGTPPAQTMQGALGRLLLVMGPAIWFFASHPVGFAVSTAGFIALALQVDSPLDCQTAVVFGAGTLLFFVQLNLGIKVAPSDPEFYTAVTALWVLMAVGATAAEAAIARIKAIHAEAAATAKET